MFSLTPASGFENQGMFAHEHELAQDHNHTGLQHGGFPFHGGNEHSNVHMMGQQRGRGGAEFGMTQIQHPLVGHSMHSSSPLLDNSTSFGEPSNPQSKQDVSQAKIFVGGLSWSSNEVSLQQYFSQFGPVDSVEIMRDRHTGNPRGFAFVIFSGDYGLERVLMQPKHIIDCKLVDVKRAHARTGGSPDSPPIPPSSSPTSDVVLGNSRSSTSSPVGSLSNISETESTENRSPPASNIVLPEVQRNKIFIGGLHHAVDRDQLKNYFAKYGAVVDACVMFDPVTRRSRGFGFITYDTNEAAKRAISIQVHKFHDKPVELKLAQPKAQAATPVVSSAPTPQPAVSLPPSGPGSASKSAHSRAMSNIDFRPVAADPLVTGGSFQAKASKGHHFRSSSAGADFLFPETSPSTRGVNVHAGNNGGMPGLPLIFDGLSIDTLNAGPRIPLASTSASPNRHRRSELLQLRENVTESHFLPGQNAGMGKVPSLVDVSVVDPSLRVPVASFVPAPPQAPQGLSELESALYKRVSLLEGQLASANANVVSSQRANVELQSQLNVLKKKVEDTRQSERALISMLVENENEGESPTPKKSHKKAHSTSNLVGWGDNPWALDGGDSGEGDRSGGTNFISDVEEDMFGVKEDSTEADVGKLQSVVSGLNERLGSHDADVSSRLLNSALLADSQTDRALVDVIVELDERLAGIEQKAH